MSRRRWRIDRNSPRVIGLRPRTNSAGERRDAIRVSSARRYCCIDTPAAAACWRSLSPTSSSRPLMFRSILALYQIGRSWVGTHASVPDRHSSRALLGSRRMAVRQARSGAPSRVTVGNCPGHGCLASDLSGMRFRAPSPRIWTPPTSMGSEGGGDVGGASRPQLYITCIMGHPEMRPFRRYIQPVRPFFDPRPQLKLQSKACWSPALHMEYPCLGSVASSPSP